MKVKKEPVILKEYCSTRGVDIRAIADTLIAELEKMGKFPKISFDELQLTMDEAVANAIEHGNRFNNKKCIWIEAVTDAKCLNVKITDEGRGFEISKILTGLKNRDNLSPRGRGIMIIKKFSTPRWNKKGNQINLRIELQ